MPDAARTRANQAYVGRLLGEKQPAFFGQFTLAEVLVGRAQAGAGRNPGRQPGTPGDIEHDLRSSVAARAVQLPAAARPRPRRRARARPMTPGNNRILIRPRQAASIARKSRAQIDAEKATLAAANNSSTAAVRGQVDSPYRRRRPTVQTTRPGPRSGARGGPVTQRARHDRAARRARPRRSFCHRAPARTQARAHPASRESHAIRTATTRRWTGDMLRYRR